MNVDYLFYLCNRNQVHQQDKKEKNISHNGDARGCGSSSSALNL